MMNQTVDTTLFRQTLTFLKQTNELTELFMNITSTDYKSELNIAKEILLNQNYELSRVISDLISQSFEIPPVYKQLFKANQVLIRLITLIPSPRGHPKPRRTNATFIANGNQ